MDYCRRHLCVRFIALAMLALLSSTAMFAQEAGAQEASPAEQPADQQDAREQAGKVLIELKERIGREENRLALLKKREAELKASSGRAESEAHKITQRKGELIQSIHDLDAQAVRLQETISSLKDKVVVQRHALRQRMVALYKTERRISSLGYLLAAKSATDLLKRSHALMIVGAADRERLAQLSSGVATLEAEQQSLVDVKAKREQSLGDLRLVEEQLSKKKFEQASLLDEAKQQRALQEKSIAKLRREANKLEQALAAVMGSGEAPPKPEGVLPEESEEKTQTASVAPRPTPEPTPERTAPFEGPGLAKLEGRLISPVDGSVIQRFGRHQHEEFSDIVFSKGLEYRSLSGAKVRAVASGKVVLNNSLPGFGNVVIVDHGSRYYTLYGRLASALCQVGDVLKANDVLGVVSDADPKGRNFYFELRVRGKAVDPLKYFKSKPKSVES